MSTLETIKHECRHCGVINAVELRYQNDIWTWPADGDKKAKTWFIARVTSIILAMLGGVVLMAIGGLAVMVALVLGR